ncbi:hypothetical protein EVAR_70373_1 [Eumeta japonica]|uniref:Uncharacterized protein n=1 Tax=Eumeta variegata TaxID=151549 RepID=A0A4C1SKP2_EUMVA|nr:hypothetical protein EVAR_70373_1 [Eumeta japonica]
MNKKKSRRGTKDNEDRLGGLNLTGLNAANIVVETISSAAPCKPSPAPLAQPSFVTIATLMDPMHIPLMPNDETTAGR